MRVLLFSTYELGHQPLHVAAPAAALRAAGHDVRAVDVAVTSYDPSDVTWADAVAFSVPMHTATRLARDLARRVRASDPVLPLCAYGLYAGHMAESVDHTVVGEYEQAVVAWVERLAGEASGPAQVVEIGRSPSAVPLRSLLPPLSDYAHLEHGSDHRRVGYTEASHGCRHRCRHCPIPAVYDGRYRIVPFDVVQADIDQLVAAGAQHVTFGDPDFLNGPHHAARVVRAAHARHPDVTYDVTVKVEHILAHREIWPELAELGVVFVVSAFETTNDAILTTLDKGHTTAEAAEAIQIVRAAGIDIRPSWLPFTPWTTMDDVVGIFEFMSRHRLDPDPVQLTVRLLIPEGSLIAQVHELGAYDDELLTYRWRSSDPRVDALQAELAEMVAAAADAGDDDRLGLLERMWAATLEAAGLPYRSLGIDAGSLEGRPRLTEPWFC